MPALAYIGVGSNLGNRGQLIDDARETLARNKGIRFLRSARIYETDPAGGAPQGKYLNTVWEIETDLSARSLLDMLLSEEAAFGRTRKVPNEPRTLDLDLLFYGDQIVQERGLTVPHPRLHERWFVLKPLWDLRADLVHPVFQKSVCELLDEINENSKRP